MPKKSRRRAKTGGGGGKVPGGGGGGGAGRGDRTAKNSDENLNPAGILTTGAVRMLLKEEYMKFMMFAEKSGPILQVMNDPMSYSNPGGVDGYMLELSDGNDWTNGAVVLDADTALMMSEDLLIKHSIIQMRHCMAAPGLAIKLPSFEDGVLLLGGVEVVARNVGRLIGNPVKVQKSSNPARTSSSSPSSGLVRDVWPYDQKLELARNYYIGAGRLFGDGSGDIEPALCHLSSYFHLPRENTEPFRAVMLMKWRIMLANWPSFMKKRNGGKFTAEMAASYERFFANDGALGHLKHLSTEEGGESVLVRSVASFIRGRTGIGSFPGCAGRPSNGVNCLRRFSVLVRECDLAELASAYEAVTIGGPSGKSMAERLITDCTNYLSLYGGPSQRQVSSMFDRTPDYDTDCMPFFLTIGGNVCDCCGKTPEDANLPVLFKCKACRLAWYCSTSCQAECWANGHRDCCKKFGRFEKGDKVILEGLKKRPDLNGTLVSVEDLPLNGRATVRVLWSTVSSVQEGAVLSIKKENLRHHRPLK